MKKIKLIVATTIITIMMLTYTINVFAAVTAGLTITPKKNVVAPGEEFTVEVKAESIDAGNNGLSKVEATLAYDDKLLNTIMESQIEGMSGWKVKYDTFSKKITAESAVGIKTNGSIFQISIKAKPNTATGTNTSGSTSNLSGGSVSLGGTSNLSGTGTSTGTTGQQTNIELKSIKLTGGLDTGTANDISTTITIGGDTAQASQQPSGQTLVPSVPTPTKPTPSVTQTPKTVVEQPTKNPKAGIEDAPIMLMAALAIVGTISFILLKKAK
jgi:hypothetical protein